eukprot:3896174-Rhodomonas_salina.2
MMASAEPVSSFVSVGGFCSSDHQVDLRLGLGVCKKKESLSATEVSGTASTRSDRELTLGEVPDIAAEEVGAEEEVGAVGKDGGSRGDGESEQGRKCLGCPLESHELSRVRPNLDRRELGSEPAAPGGVEEGVGDEVAREGTRDVEEVAV